MTLRAIFRWYSAALLLASFGAIAWAGAQTMPSVTPGIMQTPSTGGAPATSGTTQGNTSIGQSVPNAAMLYPGEDFQLGPGDLINVRVFGSSDYYTTVRVGTEGTVDLPYIGRINIESLSLREAQRKIADALRVGGYFVDPEVIIQVLESLNSSVVVSGEVRATVPVTGARRLIDVLSAAGGLPVSASHTVRIIRGNPPQTITVNLGPDFSNGDAANTLVYPRDIVQVPRSGVVYVLGAFRTQGQLALDQSRPLTLLQVAALSGGVGWEGRYNDLRLIRTFGTERRVVDVDIKKVLNGKAADPILQSDDIVYLPTNQMKAAAKSLGIGGVIGVVSLLISLRGL